MSVVRGRPMPGLLVLLLLFLLLPPALSYPTQPHLQLPFPPSANSYPIVLARGVDDVVPAFKNATETALTNAKSILKNYSSVLRGLAIPVGLTFTFFGYFLLAPVLFIAGFISGGTASFIAVNATLGSANPTSVYVAIGAMLLGGAMLGFLALRALSFGMFAVGAAMGVILASAFRSTLIAKAYPKDPQLAFIVAAVACGLVLGLLALCLHKQMLILSTAYAGSCAAVFGIGHFAGHFPTSEQLAEVEAGKLTPDAWILFYILLTLGLGTAGMFFQFWMGRGKDMPTHAPHSRRRRRRRQARRYEDDEWSEGEWNEPVYERTPPRRKYRPVERPETFEPPPPQVEHKYEQPPPPSVPFYALQEGDTYNIGPSSGQVMPPDRLPPVTVDGSAFYQGGNVGVLATYGQAPEPRNGPIVPANSATYLRAPELEPRPEILQAQEEPYEPEYVAEETVESTPKSAIVPEPNEPELEVRSEEDEESPPYADLRMDEGAVGVVPSSLESIGVGDGILGHVKENTVDVTVPEFGGGVVKG